MTDGSLSAKVQSIVADASSASTCEAWVEHRLGKRMWSKQREIAESVREHRYTAVPSCHGAGKSQLAAWSALWWANAHPVGDAFVVTAAPTQAQIEGVVWRYIGQAHAAAGLPGRVIQGNVPGLRAASGELIAWGRKPADFADPTVAMQSFQGIHAKYVLVILDEACGIPPWLWDATDTLVVNEHSRVLAIGNPDSPAARFEKVCRPGSGWNVIPISAEDTPNFTGEQVSSEVAETLISKQWVRERERRWGVSSAMFTSKVLGRFPEVSEDTLIPAPAIVQAQERDIVVDEPGCTVLACDLARLGGDHTVVYRNQGGRVRLVKQIAQQDLMRTAGDLVAIKRDPEHHRAPLVLDVGGMGIGAFDRLVEQGVAVEAFSGAERAWRPERFANRRAEAFWSLREAMLRGEVDLDLFDDELAAQLGALRWHHDSKARIVIESKDEMRKRGLPSPDRADAVSMAFWRSDWRPVRQLSPYEAAREVARQVEAAMERANGPEARAREASGAPVLTDEELLLRPSKWPSGGFGVGDVFLVEVAGDDLRGSLA